MISRNHAEFCVDLPSISVVDKGSTNGTWVNEQQVVPNTEVLLNHGDMLTFGGPSSIVRQDREHLNPFRFFFDGIRSHVIARSGTVEHMRRMLATAPQDLYTTGLEKYTCLHVAVTHNQEDIVAFLAQHCRPLLSARTSKGMSALHLAADAGRLRICRLLIDSGANLMETNNVGFTAAHIACVRSHLPVLRFLVERGFPVNANLGKHRCGLLHYSARNGSLPVLRFLLERGADPMLVTAQGCSPLHLAASREHVDAARCLIEEGGADVNQRDDAGATPLHMAVERGAESVVRLLVKLGADVTARTNSGITPTLAATTLGHTAIVNFFRDEVGVDEPATDEARTGISGLPGIDAPALQAALRKSVSSVTKMRRVDDDEDAETCSPGTIERMVAGVERGLAAGSQKDAEDVLRGKPMGTLKQVLRHAIDAEKYSVAEVVVGILQSLSATNAQGGANTQP
ncbi:unnamed protein product [Pedinophyceae sp. YPF-701]|nr:unnamed protein product [Pedinophyceae sp. YPF-701]